LNRPELTAEKFVRHPFSADPKARLYRTGDRARYREEGTIEYLGRLDHQVKIRGHRVELGEIESALRLHSGVRECVVYVWECEPGDQRLTAYIVPARLPRVSADALRHFLGARLPEHMIPSAFVPLDSLPLTPNGKVDRKSLPQPGELRPELTAAYVAPRTELETIIASVWGELLRIERVGLHDNFFDLGGHSLLVVRAQAKLRETLGLDLPIVRLFQYPTISALTKFLSEREEKTPFKKLHERARRQRAAFALRGEQEMSA
jgi:acyl carrier protein